MVVPMDSDPEHSNQFINKAKDFSYKGIEAGIIGATVCSVLGTSIGFILAWGPVICGLISAFSGFAAVYAIYVHAKKGISYRNSPKKLPEISIIVQCSEEQALLVKESMWKYGALSVGKTKE